MKKSFYLLVTLFLVGFGGNAFAQTQLEMNQTANKNFEKTDKELNQVYKKLVATLDAKRKSCSSPRKRTG